MTTCLAAVCERHQAIVIAADTKLSYGYTGTNVGGKIHGIHRDWAVLYAGSTSKCMMALDWARLRIDHLPKTADDMVGIFTKACLKYPCVDLEDRYFLLAGFEDHWPHLYVVCDDANHHIPSVECMDAPGYAAIGSGEMIAKHMFGLYGQHPDRLLSETVYMCCATKFFSERASDVGDLTEVYVIKHGLADLRLKSVVPKIRKAWESKGQLPLPKTIVRTIHERLSTYK